MQSLIYIDSNNNNNNIVVFKNTLNVYVDPNLLIEYITTCKNIQNKTVKNKIFDDTTKLYKEYDKKGVNITYSKQILDKIDENNKLHKQIDYQLDPTVLKSLHNKIKPYQNKSNIIIRNQGGLLECWWFWLRQYINLNIPYSISKQYTCLDLCDDSGTQLYNFTRIWIHKVIKLVIINNNNNNIIDEKRIEKLTYVTKLLENEEHILINNKFTTTCNNLKLLYEEFKHNSSSNNEHFPFDKVEQLNIFDTTTTINKKRKTTTTTTSSSLIDDYVLNSLTTIIGTDDCKSSIDLVTIPFLLQFYIHSVLDLKKFFKRMHYLIKKDGYLITCLYNTKSIITNQLIQINHDCYIQGNTSCCWEINKTNPNDYDPYTLYLENNKYFLSWLSIDEIQKNALKYKFELIEQTNMFKIRDLFNTMEQKTYSINEWNSMIYFDCCIFKHI